MEPIFEGPNTLEEARRSASVTQLSTRDEEELSRPSAMYKHDGQSEDSDSMRGIPCVPVPFLKKGQTLTVPMSLVERLRGVTEPDEAKRILAEAAVARAEDAAPYRTTSFSSSQDDDEDDEDDGTASIGKSSDTSAVSFLQKGKFVASPPVPLARFARPTVASERRSCSTHLQAGDGTTTSVPLYPEKSIADVKQERRLSHDETVLRNRASAIVDRVLQSLSTASTTRIGTDCSGSPLAGEGSLASSVSHLTNITESLVAHYAQERGRAASSLGGRGTRHRSPPVPAAVLSPLDRRLGELIHLLELKEAQLREMSAKPGSRRCLTPPPSKTTAPRKRLKARPPSPDAKPLDRGRRCETCSRLPLRLSQEEKKDRSKSPAMARRVSLEPPPVLLQDIDASPWSSQQKSAPERAWIAELRSTKSCMSQDAPKVSSVHVSHTPASQCSSSTPPSISPVASPTGIAQTPTTAPVMSHVPQQPPPPVSTVAAATSVRAQLPVASAYTAQPSVADQRLGQYTQQQPPPPPAYRSADHQVVGKPLCFVEPHQQRQQQVPGLPPHHVPNSASVAPDLYSSSMPTVSRASGAVARPDRAAGAHIPPGTTAAGRCSEGSGVVSYAPETHPACGRHVRMPSSQHLFMPPPPVVVPSRSMTPPPLRSGITGVGDDSSPTAPAWTVGLSRSRGPDVRCSNRAFSDLLESRVKTDPVDIFGFEPMLPGFTPMVIPGSSSMKVAMETLPMLMRSTYAPRQPTTPVAGAQPGSLQTVVCPSTPTFPAAATAPAVPETSPPRWSYYDGPRRSATPPPPSNPYPFSTPTALTPQYTIGNRSSSGTAAATTIPYHHYAPVIS